MEAYERAVAWVRRHVFLRADHISASAGATDKGRPIVTDTSGKIDASLLDTADVLTKLLTVDGAGSGVDADLLDGSEGSAYTKLAQRNQFTVAQGLLATKSSVANNSATNIATVTLGGGGALAVAFLVGIEAFSASNASGALWAVTIGYSTITATKLSEGLFGHSSIVLAASINTGTRVLTLTITQINGSAEANTIRVSVLPVVAVGDAALTIASL